MGKKILTIILSSAVLVAVFYYSAGIVYAQDSYKVNNGAQQTIDKHGVCQKVNNTSGKDVFVPVKTATEWAEFRIHAPSNISGLSLLACSFSCGDNVTFTYKGVSVTYGTVSSQGECWMDRNLGASRVATAYNDSQAYGDLFQWGRLDDGHQTRTSGITGTLSSTDNPGHSNFISAITFPYDWRSPQNNNLWQGVSGTNNPCPSAWRIPTITELDTERASWSQQNYIGAYASPLKLTTGGRRILNGVIDEPNTTYTSLNMSTGNWGLWFTSSQASTNGNVRGYGLLVRCIKN